MVKSFVLECGELFSCRYELNHFLHSSPTQEVVGPSLQNLTQEMERESLSPSGFLFFFEMNKEEASEVN